MTRDSQVKTQLPFSSFKTQPSIHKYYSHTILKTIQYKNKFQTATLIEILTIYDQLH